MAKISWKCPVGGEHEIGGVWLPVDVPTPRSEIRVGGESPGYTASVRLNACSKCRLVFNTEDEDQPEEEES